MDERFNPAAYTVTDNTTGEIVDVDMFIDTVQKSGWEKVYAAMLSDYIGLAGNMPSRVLGYLLKARDGRNIIIGTHKKIAKDSGVSLPSVKKVFKILLDKGFIKKVSNGVYMLTPRMIRHGHIGRGVMMMRLWADT